MNLADLRSPELIEDIGQLLLAVPLGATEQHGPHLPLDTDTAIAIELCRRVAEHRPDIVVAPPISYGSSGEHSDFPGTLSIGQSATQVLLTELVRSADRFRGVVIVNGHGGNLEPLRAATRTLRAEGRKVLTWSPSGLPDDSHAGHGETSVMLHLRPTSVATRLAHAGNTQPLSEIMDRLRQYGLAAVSCNGVLGDPTHASADAGAAILDAWTSDLLEVLARYCPAEGDKTP